MTDDIDPFLVEDYKYRSTDPSERGMNPEEAKKWDKILDEIQSLPDDEKGEAIAKLYGPKDSENQVGWS